MNIISEKPPVAMEHPDAWCCAFRNHELLVKSVGETAEIPRIKDLMPFNLNFMPNRYAGAFDNRPCFSIALPDDFAAPPGMILTGLRGLLGLLPDELFFLAGRSFQMIQFEQNHRFCGRCGCATELKKDEYAITCPACSLVSYPSVCPAIIVAVVKGRQLLLGRSYRFPKGRYSVLAGFVEPGETLEECVQREVREEVRLEVKNIRYFGSQPWPFPNSLMVAFTAEYAAGDIVIDNNEILDANWFMAAALPDIPAPPTIARRLIDWFIQNRIS